MYLQKEINLAIKTYLQLGSLRGTLRKLGYPSKPTLRKWIAEYKKTAVLSQEKAPADLRLSARIKNWPLFLIILKTVEASSELSKHWDILYASEPCGVGFVSTRPMIV